MRTNSEYLDAFFHARNHCSGKVLVPRFLNDGMRQALTADDPVEAWHGALRAAGVE